MEMLNRLHDLETLIDTGRSVPLSHNVMVPREEALALLDSVRDALPENLREAELILRQRDEILAEATRTADLMIASAQGDAENIRLRAESDAEAAAVEATALRARTEEEARQVFEEARAQARLMVDSHSIAVAAQDEAVRIVAEAKEQAERLIAQTRARAGRNLQAAETAVRDCLEDLHRGVSALAVDTPVIPAPSVVVPEAAAAPRNHASISTDDDAVFDIDAVGGFERSRR